MEVQGSCGIWYVSSLTLRHLILSNRYISLVMALSLSHNCSFALTTSADNLIVKYDILVSFVYFLHF